MDALPDITEAVDPFAYLCVDAFLTDMVGARALITAFETGFIDWVLQNQPCSAGSMQAALSYETRGLAALLAMLHANQVIRQQENGWHFEAGFMRALGFRDLLETKLAFAQLLAPDFLHLLTALLVEPARFVEQARVFKLFSYQNCLEATPENYAQTARWMRLTTVLTRYEAAVCLARHDFSSYRNMLDVGGNSGEFVLRLCRAYPCLKATVYDLPLVCEIGTKHVGAEPEAHRIAFIPCGATQMPLPTGFDLISFKSMLHDWPEAEMIGFLQRAHAALPIGGQLLIFERCDAPEMEARWAFGQLPLMLFFRSYRRPQIYRQRLEMIGFHAITIELIMLDMPFALITATK